MVLNVSSDFVRLPSELEVQISLTESILPKTRLGSEEFVPSSPITLIVEY